jgi:hypothetical protein
MDRQHAERGWLQGRRADPSTTAQPIGSNASADLGESIRRPNAFIEWSRRWI